MTGLNECRKFYEEIGREEIHKAFPEFEDRIAVGLAGHGSECFGYDDEISRDHDFEIGFCMWLTDEDDIRVGPRLSRLYREIRPQCVSEKSAMGEKKLGVIRISDFYRRYTGSDGAPTCWEQWMALPSYALCEAVNGEVFSDSLGVFTSIRREIADGMPEDVRKKKIAARAVEMAQSGQYNVQRCVSHGQTGSAHLAANEFVKASLQMIFLLNRKHAPYYKWIFRAMDDLQILGDLKLPLEEILNGGYDGIEIVASSVIDELKHQNLTDGNWDYLEPHAFEVMERIENREIRSMHIMDG